MTEVGRLYRRFAEVEARGLSPLYEEWALGVAGDPEVCALIAQLPPPKRQVNLVFGAARLHGVPLSPWDGVRDWVVARWPDLVPTISARSTQTNESGRCATLLPVLEDLSGPLALLEVGASAGLCLYPDRYSYRYLVGDDEFALDPDDGPSPVLLPCRLDDTQPPTRLPRVTWRAGIDLNPLDVAAPDDVAWLEALVWPEHDDRRARLTAASALVRDDPPLLVRGDLLDEFALLAADVPEDTTLVVFHSAVLVYLAEEDRMRFADEVRRLAAARPTVWIANEAPDVVPGVAEALPARLDARGAFVVSVDGAPRALVHPHGRWYRGL